MQKIDFEFIDKEVQLIHPTMTYKNSELPLRATLGFKFGYVGRLNKNETEEETLERVWKELNRPGQILVTRNWTNLPEEEFKKCLIIVEHPKPTSYPKFNNEKKFSFDSKINPEILNIRWDGPKQTWEYKLRNIGHVYDYLEEKYLKEIE
jgi:hypothetical protein